MAQTLAIDLAEVERLAGLGLTDDEIALSLGISRSTITRRKRDSDAFDAALKAGKAKAAVTVASKLMQLIDGGDLGAIVWYEKTRRGLSDRVQQDQSGRLIVTVEHVDRPAS